MKIYTTGDLIRQTKAINFNFRPYMAYRLFIRENPLSWYAYEYNVVTHQHYLVEVQDDIYYSMITDIFREPTGETF